MPDILVVCTGNVCRSPIAAAALSARLGARLGDRAPTVGSAGTHGWTGAPATPDAVTAAAELGIDVKAHRGALLDPDAVAEAQLLLGLTVRHREAIRRFLPRTLASRVFTLKEAAALAGQVTPKDPGAFDLARAVADLAAVRDVEGDHPRDDDIVDPYGEPLELYRAVAWEIDVAVGQLVAGLLGR